MKEKILDALQGVMDPEIGISIVDLGLIYDAKYENGKISVTMTMTTPACPTGDYIKDQAEDALRAEFPQAKSVNVMLTFDPPWEPEMMSAKARRILGR